MDGRPHPRGRGGLRGAAGFEFRSGGEARPDFSQGRGSDTDCAIADFGCSFPIIIDVLHRGSRRCFTSRRGFAGTGPGGECRFGGKTRQVTSVGRRDLGPYRDPVSRGPSSIGIDRMRLDVRRRIAAAPAVDGGASLRGGGSGGELWIGTVWLMAETGSWPRGAPLGRTGATVQAAGRPMARRCLGQAGLPHAVTGLGDHAGGSPMRRRACRACRRYRSVGAGSGGLRVWPAHADA